MLREISKVEQRYDAVMAVVQGGFTVTEAAQKFGVSRESVYRWMKRYEEGGLEALAEGSHRPKHSPLQTPAEIETRVVEMRRQHPLWGPLRIQHQLQRQGVDTLPSHMAIYRAWCVTGSSSPASSERSSPPINAGNEDARWSSGRWTWSVGSSLKTAPKRRS